MNDHSLAFSICPKNITLDFLPRKCPTEFIIIKITIISILSNHMLWHYCSLILKAFITSITCWILLLLLKTVFGNRALTGCTGGNAGDWAMSVGPTLVLVLLLSYWLSDTSVALPQLLPGMSNTSLSALISLSISLPTLWRLPYKQKAVLLSPLSWSFRWLSPLAWVVLVRLAVEPDEASSLSQMTTSWSQMMSLS